MYNVISACVNQFKLLASNISLGIVHVSYSQRLTEFDVVILACYASVFEIHSFYLCCNTLVDEMT